MHEAEQFLKQYPETKNVDAFIVDLCGNAVGKRYRATDLAKLFDPGARICAATYLLDARGNSSDPLGLGFSDGDPDAVCRAISGTLVPVPWADESRAQCMTRLLRAENDEPVWFEPRVLLQQVLDRFSELGLKPVVAIELEFYLIDAHRDANGKPQSPISPYSGRRSDAGQVYGLEVLDEFATLFQRIQSTCDLQNLPSTVCSSEYGIGQFEINLLHSDNVISACDHAAMQRRAIKGVCRAEGFDATFLSKPFADQSGNGMHVHVSLEDADGNPVFAAGVEESDSRLQQAVAGLQTTMHEAFAVFAPNINSYRRFAPDQFVPVTRDWAIDNRSVAFRIVDQFGAGRRIEHRIAGAEANPYLVVAAVLAGIHHGISEQLTPSRIASGNAGASVDESLPLKPWLAIDAMRNAEVLPRYFGAEYIDAYTQVKVGELDDFMGDAFSREFEWYL